MVKKMIWVVMALMSARLVMCVIECSTVTSLFSNCSGFIQNGIPYPSQGSSCCNAIISLSNLSYSMEDRQSVCRCLMGLISTFNRNATTIASLPGLCGISLGFTIEPNTDCNNIP